MENDADKLTELTIENPNLLQRSIVEVGDKAIITRPVEKFLEIIKI